MNCHSYASPPQPISAVSSSYAKSEDDDYCRQTTQDVDSPATEEIHPILKDQDPFLYYSNDRVRMTELRLQDVEDDLSDHGSSSSSLLAQEQLTTTSTRKTRITFELHPHLLLEDLVKEILDDASFDFDVISDAFLLAHEQDSGSVDDVMNHLREIISG